MHDKETYAIEINITVRSPGAYSTRTLAEYKHDQSGLPGIADVRSLMSQLIPAGTEHIYDSLDRLEMDLLEKAEAEKAEEAEKALKNA